MSKARIILSLECNRDCDYCCNKHPSLRAQMEPLASIRDVLECEEIMLTGGEPMLDPGRVLSLAKYLRGYSDARLFLYTQLYVPALANILPFLDGVHYTIHKGAGDDERYGFQQFQRLIQGHKGSFRLYIHPEVFIPLMIWPDKWARIEQKPWLADGNCPLPEGERLYLYPAAVQEKDLLSPQLSMDPTQ